MILLAEVDLTARWIAAIGAVAGVGKIVWDIIAYYLQGVQNLGTTVQAEDETKAIAVRVTNRGRRHIFVQKVTLCYKLGGQELTIDLLKKDNSQHDKRIEAYGDSEEFRWVANSDKIVQLRLGFQEDPNSPYISIRSLSGEIHRIPNQEVQGVVGSLLNEPRVTSS